MDVDWIQDFLMLAETRNFTRAASRRHVSQAAFSRRIQALERWLGAPLVDRAAFPTRLTAEGERFLPQASDILRQLLDTRAALTAPEPAGQQHVRVALPYALATARFAGWWPGWAAGGRLTTSITLGNIHDIVSAFVSEAADVLICHHGAQQPVVLDPQEFERLVIEDDVLAPYASRALLRDRSLIFPGSEQRPLPLLMYSPGVYFARLVELALEQAPQKLWGSRIVESDMADVLLDCIAAGHGIGWLPASTASRAQGEPLVPLGEGQWSTPLPVVAFRSRRSRKPAVARLWLALQAMAAPGGGSRTV